MSFESTQLKFADNIGPDSHFLLQVDDNIVDMVLGNSTLILRGQPGSHAVLCTDDHTSGLRSVLNSNTCLLIPPESFRQDGWEAPLDLVAQSSRLQELPFSLSPQLAIHGLVNQNMELVETYANPTVLVQGLLKSQPFSCEHAAVLFKIYQNNMSFYRGIVHHDHASSLMSPEAGHPIIMYPVRSSSKSHVGRKYQESHTQPPVRFTHDPDRDELVMSRVHGADSETKPARGDIPSILDLQNGSIPHVAGYTPGELFQLVQTSGLQLFSTLARLPIIFIENRFCLASTELVTMVLTSCLDIMGSFHITPSSMILQLITHELEADHVCCPITAVGCLRPFVDWDASHLLQPENCDGNQSDYQVVMDAIAEASLSPTKTDSLPNRNTEYYSSFLAYTDNVIDLLHGNNTLQQHIPSIPPRFAMDPGKVYRYIARVVFTALEQSKRDVITKGKPVIFLHEFIEELLKRLPPAVRTHVTQTMTLPSGDTIQVNIILTHLKGLVTISDPIYNAQKGYNTSHPLSKIIAQDHEWFGWLSELHSNRSTVSLFDVDSLPDNIYDRVREVFKFCPQWSLAAITPYIERFSSPSLSLKQILLAYTRAVTYSPHGQNNTVYVSR